MLREGMTRLEAAQVWVKGFNAVPSQMIAKLMQAEPYDWCEVTCPTVGDRVCIIDEGEGEGEVIEVYRTTMCKVKMDDGKTWLGHMSRMEVEYDDGLPMWGTMWSFGDSCDEHWIDDRYGYDGIMAMSQCGFRIFKSYDLGYFFGITRLYTVKAVTPYPLTCWQFLCEHRKGNMPARNGSKTVVYFFRPFYRTPICNVFSILRKKK